MFKPQGVTKMEEEEKKTTPCDYPDNEGNYHCPYEGVTSESELCRVCCGLGVDE